MGLIAPADQQRLRDAFSAMTRPVKLLFFTQTLDCETCPQTRQILDELPPLCERISIEESNFILDRDKAAQYGVDRVPAIVPVGIDEAGAERDARARFLGIPSGYAFLSLVQAILLAGGRPSQLSEASLKRIAAVSRPVTLQVFSTPT
jgi:alkyl hydroperoxide reductase subunit AhpF